MKAILMAAGRGTRISRMIEDIPKCTLPINGKPLIAHTVEILKRRNIDVVVCVGYHQDMVRSALKDYDVTYYFNPFYEITNSITSLWLARQELVGECIMMNADVFFSDDILQLLIEENEDAVLLTDETRTKTGDYFFTTDSAGIIKKYGKDLPLQHRSSEYVGMAKVSSKFMPIFAKRLDDLLNGIHYTYWWENTLYSFTDKDEYKIHTKDVGGRFWSEVDFFDDYERILNHLAAQEKQK